MSAFAGCMEYVNCSKWLLLHFSFQKGWNSSIRIAICISCYIIPSALSWCLPATKFVPLSFATYAKGNPKYQDCKCHHQFSTPVFAGPPPCTSNVCTYAQVEFPSVLCKRKTQLQVPSPLFYVCFCRLSEVYETAAIIPCVVCLLAIEAHISAAPLCFFGFAWTRPPLQTTVAGEYKSSTVV